MKKVRELFERGRELVTTNTEHYMQKNYMMKNLPSPSFRDDLVTTSTFAPFFQTN
ncbi:hypothetical protein GCM10020331_009960 [Ectobacillus funiculus]